MKRRLAIRSGLERRTGERPPNVQIVVNFAVRDQNAAVRRLKRLVSRFEVNNGNTRIDEADRMIFIPTGIVGAAVRERLSKSIQTRRVQIASRSHEGPSDATQVLFPLVRPCLFCFCPPERPKSEGAIGFASPV